MYHDINLQLKDWRRRGSATPEMLRVALVMYNREKRHKLSKPVIVTQKSGALHDEGVVWARFIQIGTKWWKPPWMRL